MTLPTRRALLSVSDKRGLSAFAGRLSALGFELVASGGTAAAIRAAGLAVIAVDDVTGYPELLGGRVKTLHPAIHAGILARRDDAHLAELSAHRVAPIDVVVCNLYPFAATVADPEVAAEVAIEQIDIGGVALLRAAAKNHAAVVVVVDPDDYEAVAVAIAAGGPAPEARRDLALRAFRHTAAYDAEIARWLAGRQGGLPATSPGQGGLPATSPGQGGLPATIDLVLEQQAELRYGENPHQRAALYAPIGQPWPFALLQGKPLSYNNIVDLDAAWALPAELAEPAVAIVKHANPCGLAVAPAGDDGGEALVEAYRKALACDPVSAFGSVIAVNRRVDVPLLEAIGRLFVEVLAAPAFAPEALAWLGRRKPNCRVVQARGGASSGALSSGSLSPGALTMRSVLGGVLVQTADDVVTDRAAWRLVTRVAPTEAQRDALAFAWVAVKYVKSNAIVLAQDGATVGIGPGQPSRVDSVRIAIERAGARARGAVLASDAFFPFADGVEAAARAGVVAIVQPGGSMRDDEVIAAAEAHAVAMVLTGVRHFRH